jgi:hypothetical protein
VGREIQRRSSVSERSSSGQADLPLSRASKRVLALAEEEANGLFVERTSTGHLVLGLLREGKSCPTLEALAQMPHDDSVREEFARESRAPRLRTEELETLGPILPLCVRLVQNRGFGGRES